MTDITLITGVILGGYILGSIPFGLLLTSLAGYGDIRKIGSGNIGATNVLRTGNRPLALLTLLLDSGKGAIAVIIAKLLWDEDLLALLAGGGAFIGHLYPLWLKFKGGKGVATFLGTIIALSWPVGVACCLTWIIVAAATRLSSLSALIAALLSPVYSYFFATSHMAILCLLLTGLIYIRHKENIRRILEGTEPKIGHKKKED
ncbi:MAG: acyl-phosphate glycerol 3-phosphate acyltransferase [Kordiimonas sp.]|nr:acyl-phosphate glycerol 3-phosphate acyltransferase [Kordiimonas sp.]|tara:strand:- start:356 stop:964 length:609 start_codon:yes stop_codon:yes gene_type:complete